MKATIFEAYRNIDGIGGSLQVAPNGMHVLGEFGLAEQLASIGTVSERMDFRDRRGRLLGAMTSPR